MHCELCNAQKSAHREMVQFKQKIGILMSRSILTTLVGILFSQELS
jgi:predicted metal-binding protein